MAMVVPAVAATPATAVAVELPVPPRRIRDRRVTHEGYAESTMQQSPLAPPRPRRQRRASHDGRSLMIERLTSTEHDTPSSRHSRNLHLRKSVALAEQEVATLLEKHVVGAWMFEAGDPTDGEVMASQELLQRQCRRC